MGTIGAFYFGRHKLFFTAVNTVDYKDIKAFYECAKEFCTIIP